MAKEKVQVQGLTDVGCVRSGNEDCFLIQPLNTGKKELNLTNLYELEPSQDLLIAVSDGMGGAAAGELASRTGLDTLATFIAERAADLERAEPGEAVEIVEKGVHLANHAVIRKAMEAKARKGMGATVTAAYLKQNIVYFFQVGDSRAYVMRGDKLVRLTRDQSFVGHLVEMGTITEDQAMKHPQRNVILQALGTQEQLKVDVSYLPLCKDDYLLICSDGLYGEIMPEKLRAAVRQAREAELGSGLQSLINLAKDGGGKDNITVVVVKVNGNAPEREPGEDAAYTAFPFLANDNPLSRAQSLFQ